jgi:hypothetical protein
MVGALIIVILLAVIVAAVITIPGLSRLTGFHNVSEVMDYIKSFVPVLTGTNGKNNTLAKPDMNVLNCRVEPSSTMQEGTFVDVFCVEICGLVRSAIQGQSVIIKISIQDITDGPGRNKTVNAKVKQYQMPDSDEFDYSADLGRIPGGSTVLNDWTIIAQLRIDRLVFAHKGKRRLQFTTRVLNDSADKEIASAVCRYVYENPDFGYVDLQENLRQSKTLTVALAFSTGAAGESFSDSQVELIRKWARGHLDVSETTEGGLDKLDDALNETLAFFQGGNKLNIEGICQKMLQIASAAGRYDALELAMQVAAAKKPVTARQLQILSELAEMLDLDAERVRAMRDKFILLHTMENQDAGIVLGVTSDMSSQTAREYLNKEYAKWNARVTCCDRNVQTQADQMLKLIAEARTTFVEKVAVSVEEN